MLITMVFQNLRPCDEDSNVLFIQVKMKQIKYIFIVMSFHSSIISYNSSTLH